MSVDVNTYDNWISRAADDLEAIEQLWDNNNRPKKLEVICHLAHQCVEKSFKAVFFKREITIETLPKTHDLMYLYQKLGIVDNKEGYKYRKYITLLNSFGPNFRYPNTMDIDEDITERVINYTRELHKLACEIN